MKFRLIFSLGLLCALLVPALAASGQEGDDHTLLRLLASVPDTPANREWVVFGDMAAWYAGWGVPRVDSAEAVDALDRDPRAYVLMIMPSQTAPPSNLGIDTLFNGDQRPFYGFDFFNLDRFISAGNPPEDFTLAELSMDTGQIAATLAASGYTATELDDTATLYSLFDDYQSALGADIQVPRVGMIGERNRIALLDGQLILARATPIVQAVWDAKQGHLASLADDPVYRAAALALADPSLAGTGELVGVILLPGAGADLTDVLGTYVKDERLAPALESLRASVAAHPLPSFTLVAFATYHAPGASYLTLALVFPAGMDAAAAADSVAARLQAYVSFTYRAPLDDRWAFDRAAGIDVDGLPVALITMRVADPPPAPEGEQANAAVFNWLNLIYRRDLGFLVTGTLPE